MSSCKEHKSNRLVTQGHVMYKVMMSLLTYRWTLLLILTSYKTNQQGCKRDLSLRDRDIRFSVRDETETETKTFLQFHETETSDFCHETRPRPCKAETETFSRPSTFQPFGHNRHGPKIGGGCAFFFGGAGSPPNNVACAEAYQSTTIPSFMLIHPTVWPQYTNVTDKTDRHTGQTQRSVAWAEVYLRTKWHLNLSSHLATTDISHVLRGEGGCAPCIIFLGSWVPI